MGCCSSSAKAPRTVPVKAQVISNGASDSGKQQKRVPIKKTSKFQWQDSNGWSDYDAVSDSRLKQAFLIGRPNAKFSINGESYSFLFKNGHMTQMNAKSGKVRNLRPARGMIPPQKPMLPEGDMIVITVKKEHVGQEVILVNHPGKKGETLKVAIPKKARAGQKIAIPIPTEMESVEEVARKQAAHNKGMSTGAKAAVGTTVVAAAGAGVLGGVILGDHLAGGTLAEQIGEGAVDAGEAAGEFAVDAGEAIGDFAEDVGEWLGDAGEDAGEWICSLFD
jgi:hypothetical protein